MFKTQNIEVTASSIRLYNGYIWVSCDTQEGTDKLHSLGFIREGNSFTMYRPAHLYDFYFAK